MKALQEEKFIEPTDIQNKTIPLILEGKDVIARSATGSGKTLAFGAGFIDKMEKGKGVQAMVLCPTRELAEQVGKSLRRFAKHLDARTTEVYGGVAIGPQIRELQRVEIVVGTPGRILDHLRQRTLDLKGLKTLVLDEADRMLDMGFIQDIQYIIEACPQKRQTLLFSATISPDIERIAKRYMISPIFVAVESYVDPSKLKQVYYDVPSNKKFSLLVHLLEKEHKGSVMVFCNTRRNADFIVKNLERYGFDALAIHGGLNQNKRSMVMGKFQSSKAQILVCTDVASRGLDIKNVSHIYNYDLPSVSNDYIHRIGRTARAGKDGIAISIVSNRDYENFRKILENDSLKIEEILLPEVRTIGVKFQEEEGDRRGGRGGGKRYGRGGGRDRGYGAGKRSFRRR